MADDLQGLLAAVRARVEVCPELGDTSRVVDAATLDQAAETWIAAQLEPKPHLEIIYVLARLHWCRYLALQGGLDCDNRDAALRLFEMVGQTQPDLVADDLARIPEMARP